MTRNLSGWYPAGDEFKLLGPRESPADWLRAEDAPVDSADPDSVYRVVASPGDVLGFDHWEHQGVGLMIAKNGGFRFDIEHPEPAEWEVCYNPEDPEQRAFGDLASFAAVWLDAEHNSATVGFGTWTRDVPYQVGLDGDELTATPA